jgi:hypothetical protein
MSLTGSYCIEISVALQVNKSYIFYVIQVNDEHSFTIYMFYL